MRSANDASVSTARAHLRVKRLPEKAGPARTSGAGPAFLDVGFGTLRNRLQLNVKNPVLGCGATVNDRFVSLQSRRFCDGSSSTVGKGSIRSAARNNLARQ
jgi:hypothetical protein